MNFLIVFVGGGLGALCRFALARYHGVPRLLDGDFPWATLWANFLACLLLGIGLALVSRNQLSKEGQLLLLTGFCGGFSTFSTFAGELVGLAQSGHYGTLAGYLSLSLVSGVGAIVLVLLLVR